MTNIVTSSMNTRNSMAFTGICRFQDYIAIYYYNELIDNDIRNSKMTINSLDKSDLLCVEWKFPRKVCYECHISL
jgi:hypothetical protein